MDWEKMIEREKRNTHKLYLYADLEKDIYYAYEFSAYLLARLFDSLELEEDVHSEVPAILYVVRIPPEFIVRQFSDSNTTVGDNFVKVVLDDPERCAGWKEEFENMKIL